VLCSECGIDILEKRFFNGSGKEKGLTQIVPNAFAATAIYKISK
jgi:hypothetical protein